MNQVKLLRIEKAIRVELSNFLQYKAKNNQLQQIVITDVHISKDLKYATIQWTTYQTITKSLIDEITTLLENHKGLLRSELAKNSSHYTVPQLRFAYNDTKEKVQRIDEILAQIKKD